jgi:hypothetical protein
MDRLLRLASVLGTTSPKTSTRSVSIPVARPTNRLPKNFVLSIVASADADIFTTLFPIRIVDKSFEEFSLILITRAAFLALLPPSSITVFSLFMLTVVSAVSADEKKPDNTSKTASIHEAKISLGST